MKFISEQLAYFYLHYSACSSACAMPLLPIVTCPIVESRLLAFLNST